MAMPNGSPTPTYNPSSLQISTWAFEALETASVGGVRAKGTPPTPIPILACTGMLEFSEQDFVKVTDRATFQGSDLFVTILIAGPKMVKVVVYATSETWLASRFPLFLAGWSSS